MKKLTSIILALALSLTLCVTAFAASPAQSTATTDILIRQVKILCVEEGSFRPLTPATIYDEVCNYDFVCDLPAVTDYEATTLLAWRFSDEGQMLDSYTSLELLGDQLAGTMPTENLTVMVTYAPTTSPIVPEPTDYTITVNCVLDTYVSEEVGFASALIDSFTVTMTAGEEYTIYAPSFEDDIVPLADRFSGIMPSQDIQLFFSYAPAAQMHTLTVECYIDPDLTADDIGWLDPEILNHPDQPFDTMQFQVQYGRQHTVCAMNYLDCNIVATEDEITTVMPDHDVTAKFLYVGAFPDEDGCYTVVAQCYLLPCISGDIIERLNTELGLAIGYDLDRACLFDVVRVQVLPGTQFTIVAPPYDGFRLVPTEDEISGVMPEHDLKVTFYYAEVSDSEATTIIELPTE